MRLLDLTLPSLAENLALDEALLLQAEDSGDEILRLWEWSQIGVVLGAGGRLADDVDSEACRRDRVPIERRSSGGGTVLLGPGCLLFSLVLAYNRAPELGEIRPSYRFILERIRDSLASRVSKLELAGTSDLARAGRKVSGNAQQRKRRHLLHHGTLLYAFDAERVSNYLRLPSRQPDYRQQRSHADFLGNLPLAAAELKRCLTQSWEALEPMAEWPVDSVRQLVTAKYSRPEWVQRH
jgi:lipoate-protein ligase A